MKNSLKHFNTSLKQLQQDEKDGKQLSQNHYGDYLMIEQSEDKEHYRVWLNHPENVKQGCSKYQIEYCGKGNNWNWKTIKQGNN